MVGQLASDVFNHMLKYSIKQERPHSELVLLSLTLTSPHTNPITIIIHSHSGGLLGDGYGFPSSHSQYMAYFATFLLLHLSFRHTFVSYGPGLRWLDILQRAFVYILIIMWSIGVAFSRYV